MLRWPSDNFVPRPNSMPILFLHGALGSRTQLASLTGSIHEHPVHTFDLSGHGARPLPLKGLSFARFLRDVDAELDATGWESAHLFGYSMGGYAALLYAARHPQRVRSVTTLGTKLQWDRDGLDRELRMLDPEKMRAKVPAFVAQLAAEHGADRWESLVHATAKLITGLHEQPLLTSEVLRTIQCPALLCVGDRDTTAVPEHTLAAARQLPKGGVLVLPNTGHPLQAVGLPEWLPHLHAHWAR